MKDNILSFSKYYDSFQKKYFEFVFGKNLINITFDSIDNIKADGIAIEEDVTLVLNGGDYFNSKVSMFGDDLDKIILDYLSSEEITGSEDSEDNVETDFMVHNIGTVLIDSDYFGEISNNNPLVLRMVIFDYTKDNPEFVKNSILFSTYRKMFKIMELKGVRRVLLKPLGIFYPLISNEDSLRMLLKAMKNFSFEKIILTVDSKKKAEELSYYLIQLGRVKSV